MPLWLFFQFDLCAVAGLTLRPGQRARFHAPETAVGLPALQVRIDPIQIMAVLCRKGVTRRVDFSEYFVFPRFCSHRLFRPSAVWSYPQLATFSATTVHVSAPPPWCSSTHRFV